MGRQAQGEAPCNPRGLIILLFLFALTATVVAQPEPKEQQGGGPTSGAEIGGEVDGEEMPGGQELGDMELEDLLEMEIEVTSVSGSAQRYFTAPAAIHVISEDDIRRSGAVDLPDLFRNVPGLNVARIGRARWAISSRGFNGVYANKLLVQKDGRSIYSTMFSGVLWGAQESSLQNLERIEVVRGPGATIWGANAVNGVINIVSKSAHETHGAFLKVTAETDGPGGAFLRYGAALDEDWSFRIHAKGDKKDGYPLEFGGSDEEDGWAGLRVGGRIDGYLSEQDELMIDFELGALDANGLQYTATPTFPYSGVEATDAKMKGASFIARWQRELEDGDDLRLQLNYTHEEWRSILNYQVDIVDLDFRHHLFVGEDLELVWGLGYTFVSDETEQGRLLKNPASRDTHLFTTFAQGTIALSDQLDLTLGTKLEHNEYSGFEIQPTLRMSWSPDELQTVWAAVSRAVHTPTRSDHGLVWPGFLGFPTPGGFPPTILGIYGRPDVKSEDLLACELGYRIKPHPTLLLEVATFWHIYDNLQDIEVQAPTFGFYQGVPALHVDIDITDDGRGHSYGAELNLRWRPVDWLSVDAWYAFLEVDVTSDNDSDTAPHHTAQLRLGIDPLEELQVNTSLYYSDNVKLGGVPSYLRWDVNVRWRIDENFELSAGVQNLLDSHHPEQPEYNGPTWEVRRLAWISLEMRV